MVDLKAKRVDLLLRPQYAESPLGGGCTVRRDGDYLRIYHGEHRIRLHHTEVEALVRYTVLSGMIKIRYPFSGQ